MTYGRMLDYWVIMGIMFFTENKIWLTAPSNSKNKKQMNKTSYLNSLLFSNAVLQHFIHGDTCTPVHWQTKAEALNPQISLKNLWCVNHIPTSKINIRIISITMTWACLFSIVKLKGVNLIEIIWHFCDIQIQQIHRRKMCGGPICLVERSA